MSDYLSLTEKDLDAMLKTVGVTTVDELFSDIPKRLRAKKLDLPNGLSQQEVVSAFDKLARKNKVFSVIMRGAGSYNHFIPPVIKSIVNRSEFLTAYTPYQAEMSQGILRAIFEYQSMICALTGMDLSNASVYNGATAAAEAALMCREKNKTTVIVTDNIRPDTLSVIKTYITPKGMELKVLKNKNGLTDIGALKDAIDSQTACVYIEQPSYFGLIEDAGLIGDIAKENNVKFIMGCNPIALALLKTPAECGADIAVGEGQPLGIPMSFGGPYLGFMACKEKEMRRLPGRIVGETTDTDGNPAYVLTLQAREQHIRRDKALSNICSNEAHCALTAAVYLAAMGPQGLRDVAKACFDLAHYAAERWSEIKGVELKYKGEFFHEFVTVTPGKAAAVCGTLEKKGILGGLPLNKDEILWCMTEMVAKEDIDLVKKIIEEAL